MRSIFAVIIALGLTLVSSVSLAGAEIPSYNMGNHIPGVPPCATVEQLAATGTVVTLGNPVRRSPCAQASHIRIQNVDQWKAFYPYLATQWGMNTLQIEGIPSVYYGQFFNAVASPHVMTSIVIGASEGKALTELPPALSRFTGLNSLHLKNWQGNEVPDIDPLGLKIHRYAVQSTEPLELSESVLKSRHLKWLLLDWPIGRLAEKSAQLPFGESIAPRLAGVPRQVCEGKVAWREVTLKRPGKPDLQVQGRIVRMCNHIAKRRQTP